MTIDELRGNGAPPVIAILRGVEPDEVVGIGAALVDAGIRIIEVPLNSPNSFASIVALQREFGSRALIGAGTVLDTASVDRLAATGAGLLVAPNVDPRVIAHCVERGLEVIPGVFSPSEALAALKAGARKLKLFPAFAQSPGYIVALCDVLPTDVEIWAVGGVYAENVGQWFAAGAGGVALGSALYKPGHGPEEVRMGAERVLTALGWRKGRAG